MIRTEFSLSKENVKLNSNLWIQVTNFIAKEWNEPKGYRIILHLLIIIPKEYFFEDVKFIEYFNKTFDVVLNDLNETYEFLKFELKNLDLLLKMPEIYCCFIEKIAFTLINLVSHPEISQDEKNLIVFQAKFAEFFNCALFFLNFPLILQKKRKFRFLKSSMENNKKEFLIFTPNYCVSCGKKISIQNRIFSIKNGFNMIICKECDYIINPYYCNDGTFLGSEFEIDSYLVELCQEKSIELRTSILNKINEEKEGMKIESNFLCLDYFFRDFKFVVILILYNIMKDFLIYE